MYVHIHQYTIYNQHINTQYTTNTSTRNIQPTHQHAIYNQHINTQYTANTQYTTNVYTHTTNTHRARARAALGNQQQMPAEAEELLGQANLNFVMSKCVCLFVCVCVCVCVWCDCVYSVCVHHVCVHHVCVQCVFISHATQLPPPSTHLNPHPYIHLTPPPNSLDTAVQQLTEVIKLAPNVASPYSTMGAIWEQRGNKERALNFYLIAAHLNKMVRGWSGVLVFCVGVWVCVQVCSFGVCRVGFVGVCRVYNNMCVRRLHTPSPHTLSTHLSHTLSTHPLHTPSPRTLSNPSPKQYTPLHIHPSSHRMPHPGVGWPPCLVSLAS